MSINVYLKSSWSWNEVEQHLRNGTQIKFRDTYRHLWLIGKVVKNSEAFKFVGNYGHQVTFSEMQESYRLKILHESIDPEFNIISDVVLEDVMDIKYTQVAAFCQIWVLGQQIQALALLNFKELKQKKDDFIIPALTIHGDKEIQGALKSDKGRAKLKIFSKVEAEMMKAPLLLKHNPEYLEDIL